MSDPLSLGDRLAIANVATATALTSGSAIEAAGLAEMALGDGRLLADETSDSMNFYVSVMSLFYAWRLEMARDVYGEAFSDAQKRGSLRAFGNVSGWRAGVHYRIGDVNAAEADARAFLDHHEDLGIQVSLPAALGFLIEALIERGETQTAMRLVQEHAVAVDAVSETAVFGFFLNARGRLHLALGRPDLALDDLHACERLLLAWDVRNPTIALWRAHAAEAQLALGKRAEAKLLAEEGLEIARAYGAPPPIGIALRVLGLAESDGAGLSLLAEAVAVLERSEARLEHARALVDLGAALRRDSQRTEAQPVLRQGLDIARVCGATALVQRAHEELLAAGARPRRLAFSGLDALTASERRVAQMAAGGMSNREIAQALFVTVKTVEMHLSNAYRKLDIQSRTQLERALSGSEAEPSA